MKKFIINLLGVLLLIVFIVCVFILLITVTIEKSKEEYDRELPKQFYYQYVNYDTKEIIEVWQEDVLSVKVTNLTIWNWENDEEVIYVINLKDGNEFRITKKEYMKASNR